jgi:threonine aldolase
MLTHRGDPPPPPRRSFASDNAAGALPEALAALAAANVGHAVAYGNDPWTAAAVAELRAAVAAPDAEVAFTFGGTGANVVALASVLAPHEAVVCADTAHLHVDECGAPERIAGTKLLTVPTEAGKLTVDRLQPFLALRGDVHHVQPRVVSVSQSTELGTVYRPAELAALAAFAHRHGMLLHVDGARLANAAASLGVGLAELGGRVGVDLLSFGGTKAGMVFGEAVVVFRSALAGRLGFARKQAAQLPSKMRFLAVQWSALLAGGRMLAAAAHANAMAERLAAAVREIPGVRIERAPEANAVFATLPPGAIEPLRRCTPFYVWDPSRALVRWMTAWDTTPADVDALAALVAWAVAGEQADDPRCEVIDEVRAAAPSTSPHVAETGGTPEDPP